MLSFILTFSPDVCQSKSFEKMNTLLSHIDLYLKRQIQYIVYINYIRMGVGRGVVPLPGFSNMVQI